MKRFVSATTVLAAAGLAALTPLTPAAAHQPASSSAGHGNRCLPTRPDIAFYEAGRVASKPITVPRSRCTTIAVSHIRDPRVPRDRCQTFLVAFLSKDGTDPTYTEPVRACSTPAWKRTVLATNVPNGAVFMVLYDVDYIEPDLQALRYKVWR
ncbi:hypothetical protein [Cryptosporangium minutisporangium]|uniref:Subtilisin inhibitor domain-containing protein n=1 Tax=Cryptosporangium minutisporangium TaxID=113569 RepID=A0ABP6SPX5_9ACTN